MSSAIVFNYDFYIMIIVPQTLERQVAKYLLVCSKRTSVVDRC